MTNGTINQDLLAIAQMGAKRDAEARKVRKAQKVQMDWEAANPVYGPNLPISDIVDNYDDLLIMVENAQKARKGAIQSLFTFRDNLPEGDAAVEAGIRAQWVRNGWSIG